MPSSHSERQAQASAGDTAPVRGPSASQVGLGVCVSILALLLWAGPERIGPLASTMLQAYLDAQQNMLAATGNLTADGRAEFAVLLRDGTDAAQFRTAMAAIEDATFTREADLPGWVVVSTTAGNRKALDALMALPQSRLVMPNRGLWICH